jgi:hypothetical protein
MVPPFRSAQVNDLRVGRFKPETFVAEAGPMSAPGGQVGDATSGRSG